MTWAQALVPDHRHAALVAEAADRRLAGTDPKAVGRTTAARSRLLIPWRPAPAR